ncbi:hypothetical protein SG9_1753 [Salmonella enterica subsp. enterica serovar Gallinarum str. SG9]|nr:hypothetical protein SG9_1753 [Salmonella enterica subsp. enterica serovar Gallinarum str. SG9]
MSAIKAYRGASQTSANADYGFVIHDSPLIESTTTDANGAKCYLTLI